MKIMVVLFMIVPFIYLLHILVPVIIGNINHKFIIVVIHDRTAFTIVASTASRDVSTPVLFSGRSNQPISCRNIRAKTTWRRRTVRFSPITEKTQCWKHMDLCIYVKVSPHLRTILDILKDRQIICKM